VRELQARGDNIIQLDVGEPDFATPDNVIKAAEIAMEAGFTHYTPSAGIPELREAVATKLCKENHLDVKKENVVITPGSKQALFYAVMALVDEGDEVIIPTPAWPSYMEMVTLAGGKVKAIPSSYGFQLDIEALKSTLNDKTKMILINSPCNPTGYVANERELRAIADIAKERSIYVLSDEIYEKLIYEGNHISVGSFSGMDELVITVNGFSKAYAMTGWRLGYLAACKPIISVVTKLQQHSASQAASFVQRAGLEALKPETAVKPMVKEFKTRRNYLCNELKKLKVFDFRIPAGAFYIFPDISKTGKNGDKFCNLLLDNGISTTPGESFGGFGWNIRISYANSMENLKEAVSRMETVVESLKA
jgi:aspartate aminotransferase